MCLELITPFNKKVISRKLVKEGDEKSLFMCASCHNTCCLFVDIPQNSLSFPLYLDKTHFMYQAWVRSGIAGKCTFIILWSHQLYNVKRSSHKDNWVQPKHKKRNKKCSMEKKSAIQQNTLLYFILIWCVGPCKNLLATQISPKHPK